MPESGRSYFVINQKSNTAFDLSGEDQRSVIGFHFHEGENQKWRFEKHHDLWTIQNCYHGKYLDVDIQNSFNDGERVVAIKTDNPRRWEVRYDDQFSGWRFFIPDTNYNADLADHGNSADKTPVTLWGAWSGQNQVWRLQDA